MKKEEIFMGMILEGWTSNYGEFLIKVEEIKSSKGKKTRVVGTILKVLSPGLKNSFKYIGRQWEFGIINVSIPKNDEIKHNISWKLRLKELDRLISIKSNPEYIEEKQTILNLLR